MKLQSKQKTPSLKMLLSRPNDSFTKDVASFLAPPKQNTGHTADLARNLKENF